MRQATISKGGQVSIPAEVRHRWRTNRVLVDDRGSELVFRPLPEDPIGAARGALRTDRGVEPTTADTRQRTREEEGETDSALRATR